MRLQDIDKAKGTYKVFLLYTTSERLSMELYDKLKAEYACTQDTIIKVRDKTGITRVQEIAYVDSFISDKWLIQLSLDKKRGFMTDLLNLIYDSSSMVIFCRVANYSLYKWVSDALKKRGITEVIGFYLPRLGAADFAYLYNQSVRKTNKLTKVLYDSVYKGYNSNVDALMDLFEALRNGQEFKSLSEIAEVCGVGNNTIENFLFSLLTDLSGSEKGAKTVVRNRVKAGFDLLDIYGYSKFQGYLRNTLESFIQIKVLRITGSIYKKIRELPEGYDETKLFRYQRYIWRLNQIPLSRLLRLNNILNEHKWTSELDFLGFIYNYVSIDLADEVKPFMPSIAEKEEKRTKLQKQKQEEERIRLETEQTKFLNQKRLEYIQKYGLIEGKQKFSTDYEAGKFSTFAESVSKKSSKGSPKSTKAVDSDSNERMLSLEESVQYFRKLLEV